MGPKAVATEIRQGERRWLQRAAGHARALLVAAARALELARDALGAQRASREIHKCINSSI